MAIEFGKTKKDALASFLDSSKEKWLLLAWKSTETLVEAINTAASINDTLLTSVEWVTFVTYV